MDQGRMNGVAQFSNHHLLSTPADTLVKRNCYIFIHAACKWHQCITPPTVLLASEKVHLQHLLPVSLRQLYASAANVPGRYRQTNSYYKIRGAEYNLYNQSRGSAMCMGKVEEFG